VAEPLYHLAEPEHWEAARAVGRYERSTRGTALADVGYVHLATAAQWPEVLRRFYADHDGDLVLLTVDPDRLDDPLRWESPHPGSDERFPHLYGPLPTAAVVGTRRILPPHGGAPDRPRPAVSR
jgi:uncharacterized protein (DUF952 family)